MDWLKYNLYRCTYIKYNKELLSLLLLNNTSPKFSLKLWDLFKKQYSSYSKASIDCVSRTKVISAFNPRFSLSQSSWNWSFLFKKGKSKDFLLGTPWKVSPNQFRVSLKRKWLSVLNTLFHAWHLNKGFLSIIGLFCICKLNHR